MENDVQDKLVEIFKQTTDNIDAVMKDSLKFKTDFLSFQSTLIDLTIRISVMEKILVDKGIFTRDEYKAETENALSLIKDKLTKVAEMVTSLANLNASPKTNKDVQ